MNPCTRLAAICVCILISPFTWSDVSAAKKAFQKKDYRQALEYYQIEARKKNSKYIQYNIAVCYYKMGEWRNSYQYFSILYRNNKNDDLILYNLALTEIKLGLVKSARDHLLTLSVDAESDEIAILAMRQLQKIRPSKSDPTAGHMPKNFAINASFGLGYDDNVLSPDNDNSASLEGDRFSEILAGISWHTQQPRNKQFSIDGSYYGSTFAEAGDFDISIAGARIKKNFPFFSGHGYAAYKFDQSALGNEDYLRSNAFLLGVRYPLDHSRALAFKFRTAESSALSDEFQSVAGDSQALSLSLYQKIGKQRFGINFRRKDDDKNDSFVAGIADDRSTPGINEATRDTFTSYSAIRSSAGLSWDYDHDAWNIEFSVSTRRSEYKDADIFETEESLANPDLLADKQYTSALRIDTRKMLAAQLIYAISTTMSIGADYARVKNTSKITNYDYTQSVLSLTFIWNY